MSPPRKHHLVAQLYQRGFARKKGKTWQAVVLNRATGERGLRNVRGPPAFGWRASYWRFAMSRRSAARRRFHRDRIVAKRADEARVLRWPDEPEFEPVHGRLEDEQWYLGCHRARCGLCRPSRRWSYGDRQRTKRQWRREEGVG